MDLEQWNLKAMEDNEIGLKFIVKKASEEHIT